MSYTFFFFNDTATTEIYPLSLHDALPISRAAALVGARVGVQIKAADRLTGGAGDERSARPGATPAHRRSEEHTSELQSRPHLVCRLLLEKKKLSQWN